MHGISVHPCAGNHGPEWGTHWYAPCEWGLLVQTATVFLFAATPVTMSTDQFSQQKLSWSLPPQCIVASACRLYWPQPVYWPRFCLQPGSILCLFIDHVAACHLNGPICTSYWLHSCETTVPEPQELFCSTFLQNSVLPGQWTWHSWGKPCTSRLGFLGL